jgi:hypothetical protein
MSTADRTAGVRHYPPVIGTAPREVISPRYLSLDERIKIGDLRREGLSIRQIAVRLGRAPSTVSREFRRHASTAQTGYRPFQAHRAAIDAMARPRKSRLAGDDVLREHVATRLKARWSPEQIAHDLRSVFPDTPARWMCAETIYQAVYRPDLGGLPRELPGRVLRRRRRQRVPRRHAQQRRARSLVNMTPISDRPAEVLERVEPGHWEGDLIAGSATKSAIVTEADQGEEETDVGRAHSSATWTARPTRSPGRSPHCEPSRTCAPSRTRRTRTTAPAPSTGTDSGGWAPSSTRLPAGWRQPWVIEGCPDWFNSHHFAYGDQRDEDVNLHRPFVEGDGWEVELEEGALDRAGSVWWVHKSGNEIPLSEARLRHGTAHGL